MKNLKLNLETVKAKLSKVSSFLNKHGSFVAILIVLGIYLFMVWRISSLTSAEPSDSDLTASETSSVVPRIDAKAIQQIQSLEQNSSQVQALFNDARNNPFHE